MRFIAVAALCTLSVLPAQAQQIETIKARGANAAGVCAGSLDMLGQYLDRASNRDVDRLQAVQTGRDFFADLPQYPATEIAEAANAFVSFMSGRIVNAPTAEERQAVQRELVRVATGCLASTQNATQLTPPPPPAGVVIPTQPMPTQPYELQPLPAQPYDTQPLILDPIVPAQ